MSTRHTNRRVTIVMDADLVDLVTQLTTEHGYAPRHAVVRSCLRRGLREALSDSSRVRQWLAEDAHPPAPLVAAG